MELMPPENRSNEEQGPAGAAAELERRDQRAERRETLIMVAQGAIAAIAVANFALWACGWPLVGPAWVVMTAMLAVANLYAQRTIRLLRRHAKDMRQHADRAYELLQTLRR